MFRVHLRSRASGIEKREGGPVTEDDVALLVNRDCDVFKPDGELLILYRRRAIPEELVESTRATLAHAAEAYGSTNRGKYAGQPRVAKVGPDGVRAKSTRTQPVASVVIGYFDKQGGRFPFCRATMFTAREVEAWNRIVPLAQYVAQEFQAELPERYTRQAYVAKQAPQEYVIQGTPYSTLTVNRNVYGRIHKDAGDYKQGFGCLSVSRKGQYRGGWLTFPEYRVAADMQDGDLIFFNPHEWHGVTDPYETQPGFERISVVYYFREKMSHCRHDQLDELRGKQRL